jgi:hypothetical protein
MTKPANSAALRQVQVGVGAASASYLPSTKYTTFLLKRREENVRILLELVWALASFGDGKATWQLTQGGFCNILSLVRPANCMG